MSNVIPCLSAVMLFIAMVFAVAAHAEEHVASSLGTDVPFDQHICRLYGTNEGLPSNWVNDVIQSRDGFVWIATDNGLVRFDGAEFKLITASSTQQWPRSEIRVLYEGLDGAIWVGTSGGLACYTPGYPARLNWVSEIPAKPVFAIAQGEENTIWVGTEVETFARSGDSLFRAVGDAPSNVRAICEARDGTLWIGSHHGLFRRRDGHYEQITHERLPDTTSPDSGVPQTRVNTILETDDGDLWIGTNRALLHWRDGQFTSRGRELDSQQIYQVIQTRDRSLYVAARFGLYRSVGESMFEEASNVVSAFCVMEHRNGGLWVGHGDNRGLMEYRDRQFRAVWSESEVFCALDASASELWFGSIDGLHRIRDGRIETYRVEDGLPDPRVHAIAPSREDELWIATAKGLVKWSGSQLVAEPTLEPLAEANIGVVFEDSMESLWIALASSGGYVLRNGQLTELSSLSSRRIHWFWEDADGVIWIGHEDGLFHYRDGQVQRQHDPAMERLNHPRFLCHDEGPMGSLWIGTSNGILRYRAGRYETFAPDCGLIADNIERLADDGFGNLWFGGRDGLFHARIEELDAYAAGRLSQVTSYRVPGFDRFPPIPNFSQGCLVRNGDLWLVSEYGLMRMPVESFQENPSQPTIRIENVVIDGIDKSFAEPFEIQSGRRRVSIDYSVLAFGDRNHVQVAYRLDGHDPQWVVENDKRFAQHTDLRPGNYQFRVKTRHANGPWTETHHPASFRVYPRWWEWTWLRVAIAIASIAGVVSYVRQRLLSAKRANDQLRREIADRILAQEQSQQHQEQLNRVSRAASIGELSTSIAHEIKQPLFAIVSNAQTARKLLDREQPDVEEVREALADIASDGNRASAIIDRVRALAKKEHRPVHDVNINEVVSIAASFAKPEILRRRLQLQLELGGKLPLIIGDPIELQQVIMNLVINAAQAMEGSTLRELSLRTSAVNNSVQVAVQDHGTGIDEVHMKRIFEPFYTTKPDGTGLGLAINRTIIDAHGGRIWAERNLDQGMTFFFQVPASEPHAVSRSDATQSLAESISGDQCDGR